MKAGFISTTTTGGAVLMLCLLLLIALGLLGLAAASDHLLQTRMTGNLDDQGRADQSAASALAWGEAWLFGLAGEDRVSACSTACESDQVIRASGSFGSQLEQKSLDWWRQNAFRSGLDPVTGSVLDGFESGPLGGGYWLIEELHDLPKAEDGLSPETVYYRVMARGLSQPGGSWAVTESIIARPWGDAAFTQPFPAGPGQAGLCTLLTGLSDCGRRGWRKHH